MSDKNQKPQSKPVPPVAPKNTIEQGSKGASILRNKK